ncbi:MAG: hypothetical protein DRJ38_08500 [Thermoprotei archaeon]|nr:MAG: hypothetical protein DRJ38_08500 [Thermoprotei archaeon]
MKPKIRSLTLEVLAEDVLTSLGYNILDRNHRVRIEGVDVAEVDLIAEKNDEKYAVEVKAGTISVTDIRQAYTNALILGYKPLIICRGYSDESARILAEHLNIDVVKLQDFIVLSTPEEIYNIFFSTLVDVLLETISPAYQISKKREVDIELLKTIIKAKNLSDAANKLGITVKKLIAKLKEIGLVRKTEHGVKDFNFVKLQALLSLIFMMRK